MAIDDAGPSAGRRHISSVWTLAISRRYSRRAFTFRSPESGPVHEPELLDYVEEAQVELALGPDARPIVRGIVPGHRRCD